MRKGLGIGKGQGYRNIVPNYDSHRHSLNARGYKMPQRMPTYGGKNLMLKERPVENPYEIWRSADGQWEWRVLKKWQENDDKPYARWFCAVKSPMTFGSYDIGDVYIKEIKEYAKKLPETDEAERLKTNEFARDKEGKISQTILSKYGEKELALLDGAVLHFTDAPPMKVEGKNLIDTKTGRTTMPLDNDRIVNKIIYRII